MLAGLAPFPLAQLPNSGGAVFAEALALPRDNLTAQPAAGSNSEFPITHLAAIFPAHVIDGLSAAADPALLEAGRTKPV